MEKTINFGKYDFNGNGRKENLVTIDLELKERENGKMVFTACGNVWNRIHTDIIAGGQCLDSILESLPSLKANKKYMEIVRLWKRWHLNDMNAGTVDQMQAIEKESERQGKRYLDYESACNYLKAINLYEVEYNGEPYKYGHKWIYEPIDQNDLEAIKRLITE